MKIAELVRRVLARTQFSPHLPIKVNENGRYFVDQSGSPVFWLGTTQWELFRGYSQEDARTILEESRKNGFTAVQVGFLGVGDGTRPNFYGQKPWLNNDPLMPNDAYSATWIPCSRWL